MASPSKSLSLSRGSIPRRRNKHNARVIWVDGEKFDSGREYRRWCHLKVLEKAGMIRNLERQVEFRFAHADGRELKIPAVKVNPKATRRYLGRVATYTADFVYEERDAICVACDVINWRKVVEDCKGHATEAAKLRLGLMAWHHGIEVRIT